MRCVVQVRRFGGMKITGQIFLKLWRQFVFVDWRNYIGTYLRYFGSGQSPPVAWLSTDGNTVPVRVMLSVSPWNCKSCTESFSWIWTMKLLGATGLIKHFAVSVWTSGELTDEKTKGRCDHIDRNSSAECKHLNPHAPCGCGASWGMFINIVVFGVGLGLCLSNRQTLLFLVSHFRSLIITIVICIVFPSGISSKFLTNISQFPHSVLSHPLSYLPNTICCQHTIPPALPFPHSIQSP